MAKCMCGAVIKVPHKGDCHFGWHNPDTCPQLNCPRDHRDTESGNMITADEKKEIEDMILGEIASIIEDHAVLHVTRNSTINLAARKIIGYLESIGYRAPEKKVVVKHPPHKEGSRFHVISWSNLGRRCSEPNCEINDV